MNKQEANLQSKQAQIRRKLDKSGITKSAQFEEIISKLIGQKERLEQDLRMLREKVLVLHEKQAQKSQKQRAAAKGSRPKLKPQPVINHREELNRKHQELKLWQKRVLKASKNEKVEVQHREMMNKLASIEQEISSELQRYSDEKMTYKRLRKALKMLDKQDQKKSYLEDGMQRENKLLKKRVFSLKKMVDHQISKEIDLQNHLIDIRDKERLIEQLGRQAKRQENQLKQSRQRQENQLKHSRHSKAIQRHKTQVKAQIDSSVDSSEKQDMMSFDLALVGYNLSKDEIYQLEGHLNRMETRFRQDVGKIQKKIKKNYPNQALGVLREGSKLTFGKELEIILQNFRKGIHNFSDLNRQKISILLQKQQQEQTQVENLRGNLGYTSTSIARGLRASEMSYHSSNRSLKRLAATISPYFQHQSPEKERKKERTRFPAASQKQKSAQTQDEAFPLRRQFIGEIHADKIDDRELLGGYTNSTINSLKVFYTDRGVASIQAFYNLNTAGGKILEGKLVLPPHFIENYCKVHTIEANKDDFIRYFKLRYSTQEGRITALRVVTNRNTKNGYGEPKYPKGEQFDDGTRVQKEYVLDIGKDEFPVSIFCSHVQKGPYWYLCGFGVEIQNL